MLESSQHTTHSIIPYIIYIISEEKNVGYWHRIFAKVLLAFEHCFCFALFQSHGNMFCSKLLKHTVVPESVMISLGEEKKVLRVLAEFQPTKFKSS